jgi:hypothetical protein
LHGVGAGDVNGDGKPDLLTAFGWFEAPADARAENWTWHEITVAAAVKGPRHYSHIHTQDVNGDGRNDLIFGHGHGFGIYWLENQAAGWKLHLIDQSWSQAHAMTLVDLDRDGQRDFVTGKRYLAHDIDPGAYEPLGLYWYRLNPDATYTKHVIDFGGKVGGGMQLPVVDVDGDGFLDIVGCAWFSKQLRWFENPRRFDGEFGNLLWKEHVVETGFNYELAMQVDVDGDGKANEILPNYGSSNEIAWWEAVKGQWVRHLVGKVPNVRGLHGVGAGDVNGDGKPDLLTAFGWFEAPADARAENWTWHEITVAAAVKGPRHYSHIHTQDVNGDGRNDLVFGHGHSFGIYWLENKAAGWTLHTIDDSWSQAHAMTLVDLDRDGQRDFVTGKRYLAHDIDPGAYEPLGLYWYRLNPDATYTKHVIDFGGKVGGGMQLPVVDVDGDGDLDIVAPGKSGLYLFEQIQPARQKAK